MRQVCFINKVGKKGEHLCEWLSSLISINRQIVGNIETFKTNEEKSPTNSVAVD